MKNFKDTVNYYLLHSRKSFVGDSHVMKMLLCSMDKEFLLRKTVLQVISQMSFLF